MIEKTHHYKAPCGRTIHLTDSKEGLFIRTGNTGDCPAVLWDVMSRIINASKISRKELIEILSDHVCEKSIDGKELPENLICKSCPDRVAKFLKEDK